ncbi:hypothetical protein ZIOFF_062575 [Zingiber officinale]|uniref:Deoxyuridine 5'-triphosphate nucleotidohydrolase n=1 Tax=Zingiber officinale TaxID=94328 RepID=A0A8J5F244_ZINOF|nr:hypothetical protein ZIOFF_062575 [Zingiber officinale]
MVMRGRDWDESVRRRASIQARNNHDEDEERAHTIAVLLKDEEEDVLYVKCLTSTAVLPQRKTEGAAGYDLAVNQNYHILPYGQAMLNTGISIKVPKGTYARVAARSSYAMRGMIIGGVIDPDYRGEIKIFVYNYSDDDMDFAEGENIGQLILECFKTPPIIQVHDLDKTKRQYKGFGSTSQQYPCTSRRANPLCRGCPNCDDDEESAAPYEYYVAPHPNYIDDREYIEYQPPKSNAAIQPTVDETFIRTMDSDGEGSSSTNPNRRSSVADPGKAQYEGVPAPSGPYHLLEQYAELACSARTSILHPEEHDKRSHMADIEWIATRNVINNLQELELICQVKEIDFRRRGHHEGQSTYWKDALPAITKARLDLWETFIRLQAKIQGVRDNPP